MGASLNSPQAGRSGQRKFYRPNAEINITPFVDVMLVLLIIFMVAAPLMTTGINVNLPQVANTQELAKASEPVIVQLGAGGEIFVNEAQASPETLPQILREKTSGQERPVIQVKADRSSSYQAFMELLGRIQSAGFSRLALETVPPPR